MEIFYNIVAMLGGLSMFLYGMRLMGDGLKSCSGGAMKAALAKVTNRPFIAFLLGMLVTCMIQSSTATIVLTVGLVGAGFLTFRQSIGIVLGANVGTAITAQIIRLMDVSAGSTSIFYFFKADNLAPIALILGIIMIMFLKKDKYNNIGTIAIGFGILFMGLIFMSDAVSEMGSGLTKLLTAFEGNYFLGFLSGVLVTGVIQSSSAVVGILQSLASSVGIRFCGVFAVIIGVNIGDCLTTYLVSRIGAKPDQIRTAVVHVVYNVFAATLLIVLVIICRATGLLDNIWNMELDSGGVANLHGLFRIFPAVVLLPFTGLFAKITERLVPDRPMDNEDSDIEDNLRELDSHLISNPGLALDQTAHLIGHMADVASHNVEACSQQIFDYDPKRQQRMTEREDLLDRMADASNRYIVDISPYIITDADNRNQNFQIKALTCFERIGDLAINISNDVEGLRAANGSFSEMAMSELHVAMDAVQEILGIATEAYKTGDLTIARRVEPLEEVIDEITQELKGRHICRMTQNLCNIVNGIQFQNILQNLERISDQCSDLAVYMLSRADSGIAGKEHQYIHNLHHSNDPAYMAAFQANYDRYFTRLKDTLLTMPAGNDRPELPAKAD